MKLNQNSHNIVLPSQVRTSIWPGVASKCLMRLALSLLITENQPIHNLHAKVYFMLNSALISNAECLDLLSLEMD